jgi:GNAT superfamily N-acetyltransferase
VIGTVDSAGFHARCEADWFPPLRLQHPLPSLNDNSRDASLVRILHRGHPSDPALADYPAHLHIDLLPVAQGQGWGTMLMDAFLTLLRARGVAGVHLGVGSQNTGGIAFYRRYGFAEIARRPWGLQFGLRL